MQRPHFEHVQACLAVLAGDTASVQEALERAQAADYVEMRLCKHEDPLLANIANT